MLKKVYIAFLILLSVLTVLVMVTPLEFENYFYFLISFWLTITLNIIYFFKYLKNKYIKVLLIISIVISVLGSILMVPFCLYSKIEGTNDNKIAYFGLLMPGNAFFLKKNYTIINNFLFFNVANFKNFKGYGDDFEELKKNYRIPLKDIFRMKKLTLEDGTFTFAFPEERIAVNALQDKLYKLK